MKKESIEGSYEIDPCSLDESDYDYDENVNINIDNWKPTAKRKTIIPSKWRQEQINGNFNQEPSIDDLKKILTYIKNDYSDAEIMHSFGINAKTMTAIKENRYSPVDGISLDNLSKIYSEFNKTHRAIEKIYELLNFFKHILMIKDSDFKDYQKKKKEEQSQKAKKAREKKKREELCDEKDTSC